MARAGRSGLLQDMIQTKCPQVRGPAAHRSGADYTEGANSRESA